ncbi:MAG: dihydrolipoyl dehydrogenase [Spirochaetales bacterium]|nr:dihydrolipoyl dehydrogenase [Spirochaetales bacterium]
MNYQLIVIGAGPGGYEAALAASKLGLRTAVIEKRELGGTCLNRGCIPTKALLHASETYRQALSSDTLGIHATDVSLDIQQLYQYKDQTVEKLRNGVQTLLKAAKVDVIQGRAKINNDRSVSVEGPGAGTYTADNILIATGSEPSRPPIPGLDNEGVLTSDELLEKLDILPESIVIIGGGVIGVEFATFFNDLGCTVTVIEALDRLLPNMDRELGQGLAVQLKKRGVNVFTSSKVSSVSRAERLTVNFTQKEKENTAEGEIVLCAIGRRPYTEGLFAPELGIEMDGRRIKVDENFRTSVEGIYAIGDVSSKIQLAHVAMAQGIACVRAIAGKQDDTDLNIVPSCVYTRPEIASVGMTEEEAKMAQIPVKTAKVTMFSNARTIIANGDRSFMKLVVNAETNTLIGAQLMCERASDIIGQLSQAIAGKQKPHDLLKAMRPHPTYEEALTEVLKALIE